MITWDEKKNTLNRQKHGLSFEAARLVFDDPLHVTRLERVENNEQRYQTVGQVEGVIMILVAHTWSELKSGEEHIRIISARRATKAERKIYEQS